MKKFTLLVSLILAVSLLAGCAGTPVVYYSDCTCPADAHVAAPVVDPTDVPEAPDGPTAEGALKTGLAVTASIEGSSSASADAEGVADYDVTMVAVLVDDEGVIHDCIIDGISAKIKFDAAGAITTDLTVAPQTKNELGSAYNMVAWGNAKAEWNEQAAAVADYVIGKNALNLTEGTIDEAGYAIDGTDLASSASINLYGIMNTIAKAAENAKHLGAQAGDALKFAATTNISGSSPASAENAGNAQFDADVVALTMNGETITSCYIDSLQAKVAFDAAGAITSDVSAAVATKNELGAAYNMVNWGNAKAEWNEQAAAFAAYVTGKTVADVAGIRVDESTKPADADLAASVTIKVGGFMDLIAKAAR